VSTTDDSAIQDLADAISSTLDSNDAQGAQRLETLGLVYQARVSQLQRDAAAVTALYGPRSAQAAAAQAAATSAQGSVARLGVLKQRVGTPAPEVPSGGWVLHGRVYDDAASPVAEQTVFLVDVQGTFQRAYGFAYTDDSGYFALTGEGPAGSTGEAADEAATAPVQELYVEVANAKRQPVHLSSTAFQPAAGTATYQNIQLSPGGKPIGDPPRAVREVALPKTQRASGKRTPTAQSPKRSSKKPRGGTA
jgi:hypothetical protein